MVKFLEVIFGREPLFLVYLLVDDNDIFFHFKTSKTNSLNLEVVHLNIIIMSGRVAVLSNFRLKFTEPFSNLIVCVIICDGKPKTFSLCKVYQKA